MRSTGITYKYSSDLRRKIPPWEQSRSGAKEEDLKKKKSPENAEITEKIPERRIRKSSGGSDGMAYIQVIPLNEAADDLHLVKMVLTSETFPYRGSLAEISSIAATTECTKRQENIQCECEPGFDFDIEQCKSHPTCFIPMDIESYCFCPHLDANSTVYCEEPPTIPGNITSSPDPARVGSDVVLEFTSVGDITNVQWLLVDVLSNMMMEVHNGTRATVVTSNRKSTLSIKNVPRYWGGLYLCRFLYRNIPWQVRHVLEFPLNASDIILNPSRVFFWNNVTIFSGIIVECCIPDDEESYYVIWEPGQVTSDPVDRGYYRCYPLSINKIPVKDRDYRCIFQGDIGPAVESKVRVSLIKAKDKFCSEDGDAMWKATKAGYDAEILCERGKIGRITRSCSTNGQWSTPESSCVDARLQTLLEQAQSLVGGLGIPDWDIPVTMETLRNCTMPSLNFITYPSDMIIVVETIKVLSTIAVENNVQLQTDTMVDLVTVYSRLLNFNIETFWTPALAREPSLGSTFLQSVETISKLFEVDSNCFMFIQHNFQMSAEVLDLVEWTNYNRSFNMTPDIELDLKNIESRDDRSNVTVISMVLRYLGGILPKNFGDSVKGYGHSVESHIVIITIKAGNQTVKQANLDMIFDLMREPNRTNIGTAQCVFWDNSLFEGVGGWSTEGCKTFRVNESIMCRSRQVGAFSVLTSFGVFKDVLENNVSENNVLENNVLENKVLEDGVLETVSQVGSSLSILSLIICIIVYIIEWKSVVKDDITFYRQVTLINISVSRLIADVWFFASTFITKSHANKLCISAAFFQHFFYLASLSWMLVQGLILLYELVFTSLELNKVVVIVAMVGLGYVCPLIIASVTIGIDYPKEEYITDRGCFLNREDGAIFAFSGPAILVSALNFLTIGAMVWKFLHPPAPEDTVEDMKSLVAKALAILTSLFGITWFLEMGTLLDDVHQYIHYALTFFNSFQGVIILIFGCLLDKRIREALAKRFQKLQSMFPSPACCEHGSYNVEQISETEVIDAYRQIFHKSCNDHLTLNHQTFALPTFASTPGGVEGVCEGKKQQPHTDRKMY
ncbi:adhesion G-protein coupled receptor F3-like [Ranitomeya variabilis]|uniref:adhesion G-protein coupled receptor F3-like n=1 Tax=Ranitomeya variabilis TaxID=490064 RepID=UPI0040575277